MDTVWVLITASLVFFMNLGFALVESGFCRAKNTVNILSKNFIVFAISCLAFYVFGWGLMFGNGTGFIGLEGLFVLGGADNSPATGDAYVGAYKSIAWTGVPLNAKFFFQLVFAGTAATIVSGAVAERIKYLSFIVFSFLLVAFVYPITGHWIWGGGFLASAGFWDFAGSTVVHSVGGWAALAGILILGPRLGKYGPDGKVNAIPPHSFTSGVIGCFVLWLGWFGFNPGSTMAVDANAIAHIFMTTNTAAFMGLLSATALNWIWDGKPDLSMSVNGVLAGLVAITAPCAFVTVQASLVIGLLAGVLVVFAVKLLDTLKIDDPGRRGARASLQRRVRHALRRPLRRRQDHRRGDGQRPVLRRRHDAADGAAQGHRRGGGLHARRVVDLLARSSSTRSGFASARRKKSKVSTSASTARRRTSDLRRLLTRRRSGVAAFLTRPAVAACAAGHLIWRTP